MSLSISTNRSKQRRSAEDRCCSAMTSLLVFWLMMFSDGYQLRAVESPRITPTVKIIERVQPSVVPLFTRTGANSGGTGSGVLIHPDGYILTADHVTQDFEGVALFGLQRVPYEIVGRLPEKDLAILKVSGTQTYEFTPLGRSHDLKAGEPIIVGGNPSGRGVVFAQGTINAPSIDPSWPNILAKSFWRTDLDEAKFRQTRSTGGRPDYVQFDASTNRGNSGGPLINYEGQVIGIVAQKSFAEEGINWAIPADRIRLLMPYLVQPEEHGDFELGLEIDMLADQAVAMLVMEDSILWNSGLRANDVITDVNDRKIRSGIDWLLSLWGHKSGDEIELKYARNGEIYATKVALTATASPESALTIEGKQKGIRYAFYKGRYPAMPDFEKLEPVKRGIAEEISSRNIAAATEDAFAIHFTGYLEFPKPGLYRLHLASDDGSRLHINDRLFIDNDLPHPLQKLSRWIRVRNCLVPFRLEYAETSGQKALQFTVSNSMDEKDVTTVQFYMDAEVQE